MAKIDKTKLPKDITDKYQITDNTFSFNAKNNLKDLVQVELGDSKTPAEFFPQQKIQRWDNEVNFSLRLIHNEKTPTVTAEDGKIKWKGEYIEAHFYDINNTDHPEGASELEVILKEKPKTNILKFSIETKGLEFFYQPELTQQEKDEGAIRPENVINSYAVYYKDCPANYVDGKLYRTGKAFHIYRIKATDVNGVSIWGKQNINVDKKLHTIEIPQSFLDSAVYPVVIDPTFGYTTAGGTTETNPLIVALRGNSNEYIHTAVTGDIITSVSLYASIASGSVVANMGVYTYVGGVPVTLTGSQATATVNSSTAQWWQSSTVSITLTNGVAYCSAFDENTSSGGLISYYDTATGNVRARHNTSKNYGALPSIWINANFFTPLYSIYATYTAAGGGAVANTSNFFQFLQ